VDWWQNLGAYAQFFGNTPALAVDFATRGPNPDLVGYNSAYALQTTQANIDVYEGGQGAS
jgi:hypothetical protein